MPKRRRIKPFVKDLYWLPVRYVNKAAVRRYFKFTFGPDDDRETVLLFRVRRFPDGRDWIGLPKGQPDLVEKCLVGGFGMDRFRDLRCRAPADIPLKFNGKYRNYQVDAVLEMLDHENGVLSSKPRTGKTLLAVAISIERQVKTLILAHQTDLIEQFCNETINDASGQLFDGHDYLQSGEPIAGICTRLDEFERHPICLATYQTFITRKGQLLLSKIKDMFGMVVTDEIHRGPAKEYSRVLTRFSATYMYGLTATPARRDNRYVMADRIIGPVVHKTKARALKPRVRLIDTGGRIGIKQDDIPENFTSLVNYMAGNDKRNAIIAKAAVHEADKGHNILIPTLRIEHAEELARRINAEWGEEICFQFTGRIPKRDRQKARDRMNSDESIKVVMATRSMLLGMNIARWSCLISISLIANKPVYDQEVQRICTDVPGKKQPEVIYVLDSDIGWAWGCFRKSKQTLTDPEIISDMSPEFRRAAGGGMKR